VKYAFICGEEGNYPVAKMCRWAKVSRSGYYEWHGRGPSSTELRRRRLATLVAWSFKDSDGTTGTGGCAPTWPGSASTPTPRRSAC